MHGREWITLKLPAGLLPALTLVIAAAVACRAPQTEPPPSVSPQAGAEVRAPAPLAERAAPADHAHAAQAPAAQVGQTPTAPDAALAVAPEPNRDRHGNRDVAAYVVSLERAERIEHLRIDTVVAALALPPDAEVGDLGCGPGLFAEAFARACPEGVVYASDVEPRQLDALRARIARAGLVNVLPILASPGDPHFPPGRLDLVFVADTWHHLEERVAYARALQRVLKPGGRLALLEYKPGDLPVGPPARHKLGSGELAGELTQAGFVRVESFDTHRYHDFEIWRVVQAWERR